MYSIFYMYIYIYIYKNTHTYVYIIYIHTCIENVHAYTHIEIYDIYMTMYVCICTHTIYPAVY